MKELTASWPGGAPFSNLMGLYGVLTLSRGEWGWRRSLTMVFIMLTRAMAVVPFSSFICLAYAPFRNSLVYLSLHEGTVDLLLVDVLDHRLVVIASKLLVVVVHLHPWSPPSSPGHHVDT